MARACLYNMKKISIKKFFGKLCIIAYVKRGWPFYVKYTPIFFFSRVLTVVVDVCYFFFNSVAIVESVE